VRSDSEAELNLTQRFVQRGFTDKQAKLKTVWRTENREHLLPDAEPDHPDGERRRRRGQDKPICRDKSLLERYACETASGYCAGCTRICQMALASPVPVGM